MTIEGLRRKVNKKIPLSLSQPDGLGNQVTSANMLADEATVTGRAIEILARVTEVTRSKSAEISVTAGRLRRLGTERF